MVGGTDLVGDINLLKQIVDRYKKLPKTVKASLWFLFCSFLQKGITVITTPIFTRLLTTEEYGNYSVFNSWLGIITIFVGLNLYSGLYMQGLVKFENDRYRFSSSLQGLSLFLVFIWTTIYLIFCDFFNHIFSLTTVQMIAMLILIWTTAVFTFWATEQRVNYEYKNLVIITALVSFVKPIIGIIFVIFSDDKVTARIFATVLVEVVAYSGLFFLQMQRGKCFFNAYYWKYALCFNLPLIPHYLSQIVLNNSDRLMIKSMVGASEAGIYSLAYALAQVMILFNSALLSTFSPWLYQRIKNKEFNRIAGVVYSLLSFVGSVNILLIIFAPEIVKIFAPPSYYDAIWIIPPVAMSVFFMFLYNFFACFEFYYEKSSFIVIASIFGAVLNLGLNYIFINLYGYYAAGYTTLFCFIVYAVGHYVFMKIICKQYLENIQLYSLRTLIILSLFVLFIGFGIMSTYSFPVFRYGIVIIIVIIAVLKRRLLVDFVNSIIRLRNKSNS